MIESPTRTIQTQSAHVFASIVSYIKLEKYKFSSKLKHFALRSKLLINATKVALNELQQIKLQLAEFESMTLAA
jgi:hypothetical protein